MRFVSLGSILLAMSIKDNILATLAYYDVQDFPLKSEEIERYLMRLRPDEQLPVASRSLENILACLNELVAAGVVFRKNEYYYLFDREYLVPLRYERWQYWRKKWSKTLRIMKWVSFLPFLPVIFASGSLALRNTNELSDLDVLIIAKQGRIWTARFLLVVLLELMGVRRRPSDLIAPDLVCPNHFIADNELHIPIQNIYTAQLYANLVPLIVHDDILESFRKENSWLQEYLYRWQMDESPALVNGRFNKLTLKFGEWLLSGFIGRWLEGILRRYQIKRITANPLTGKQKGRIAYSENEIAFHLDSPDARFIKPYKERLAKLGILFEQK